MRTLIARSGIVVISATLLLAGLGRQAGAQNSGDRDNPSAEVRSALHDEAGLFPQNVAPELHTLLEITEAFREVPTLIETINGLDDRDLDEVMLERARGSGREGLYVLIDAQGKEISLAVSSAYQERIDVATRRAIRDVFVRWLRARDERPSHRAAMVELARLLKPETSEGTQSDESAREALEEDDEPFRNVGVGRQLVSRDHIHLSLGGAEMILRKAEDQARSMELKVNIAVVDEGGHLVAFARMDGARPGSGNTALTKAIAAATFRMPTGPIPPGTADPDPILNLGLTLPSVAGGGRSTPLYGGVPIEVEGQVIGAVGVGGATGEQDAQIARAGIAALVEAISRADDSE